MEFKTHRGKRLCLKIDLMKKGSCGLLPEDTLLGFQQFVLDTAQEAEPGEAGPEAEKPEKQAPEWRDAGDCVFVNGKGFSYCFDKMAGSFSSMVRDGVEYLHKPMDFQISRAPLDNDMFISGCIPGWKYNWATMGIDRIDSYTYETKVIQEEGTVVITCPLSLVTPHMAALAYVNSVYKVDGEGRLDVRLETQVRKDISWLPRFGIRMVLDGRLNQCSYYGYGPMESYVDKKEGCYLDRFTAPVSEMFEDYIKPQENSSHCGTQYCALSDEDTILRISSGRPFSFNVSEYTREELAEKGHHFELEKSGYTILHLDYYMSGVGTGSCGPMTRPEYRLEEKEFCFAFTLDWQEKAD